MRFKIYLEETGSGILSHVKEPQWRWRLVGNNGKTVADSAEGYDSLQGCKHGIDLVKGASNNTPVEGG